MPLVEKCVTVDGSAVKNPMNVLVPIGMRMKDVFEADRRIQGENRRWFFTADR